MKKRKPEDEKGSINLTGHVKLERRRLLNADFGFDTMSNELTLFDFENSDAMMTDETVRFVETMAGDLTITLSEGE